MSDETKAWWQSRTIIGVIVILLAQLLKYFKVDIVNEELTEIVTLVMDFAGTSLAIYGRVKARKQIKRTAPGGKFNPKAEVRKAKPVRKKVFGVFLLIACANICYSEIPYPSHVWYDNPIEVHPIEDRRSFIVRLLDSLFFSMSVFPLKGEIRGNADF